MMKPGSLHLPLESYEGPQSTKDVISRFLQGDIVPQQLRGVYHGACHVRFLQKLREAHGKVFLLPSNDTPAFLLPFYTDTDWRITQPVTLYAVSKMNQAGGARLHESSSGSVT